MKNKILISMLIVFWTYSHSTLKAEIISSHDCEEDCSCGINCYWEIDTSSKTLTVTGNGKIKDFERICTQEGCTPTNAPWQKYDADFSHIAISEGFTSVGTAAFCDIRVDSVSLPSTMEELGLVSFENGVSQINIPEGLKKIGDQAFSGARLTTLQLGDKLEYIGDYAFANTNFENLIIPDSVTYIGLNAFGNARDGWHDALLKNLYCEEDIKNQCDAAIKGLQDAGKSVSVISYQKQSDGRYVLNGVRYQSFSDMQNGQNGISLKRIYTIDEATKLSKKTGNTFKLRYK